MNHPKKNQTRNKFIHWSLVSLVCGSERGHEGGREKFPAVEDAPHGRGQQKYSLRFSTLAAAAAADLGMNDVHDPLADDGVGMMVCRTNILLVIFILYVLGRRSVVHIEREMKCSLVGGNVQS